MDVKASLPVCGSGGFLQPNTTRGICLAYFSLSVAIHVMEVRGLWAMTHNEPIRHVFKYQVDGGFFSTCGL